MDSRTNKSTKYRLPGRPRNPKVEEAVLAAARDLLVRGGYHTLSFEAVAQMTGVTRPTIYRRWPSKAHLAFEIANGNGTTLVDVIEKEGLRAQIRALAEQTYSNYDKADAAAAVAGVVTACHSDPDFRRDLIDPQERETRRQMREIVDKGKAMGVIRENVSSDTLVDVILGTILTRAVFGGKPFPSSLIDDLTDLILSGIQRRPPD